MNFQQLIKQVYRSEQFMQCFARAAAGEHFSVTGLGGSSISFLAAGLAENGHSQLIFVVPDYKTAELLRGDLESFTGNEINYFPAYRGFHLEDKPVNKDIHLARLKCLQNLSMNVPGIYLVEIRSLLFPILSKENFNNRVFVLKTGDEMDRDFLVNYLVEEGFHREAMVSDFGEISVRGGIVDVFSPSMLEPVRIEIDYDRVESIRIFDINDQRSIKQINETVILPPFQDVKSDYTPSIPEFESSVLSYFSSEAPVLFHQPAQSKKALIEYFERWQNEFSDIENGNIPEPAKMYDDIEKLFGSRKSSYIKSGLSTHGKSDKLSFNALTIPGFNRNLKMFSKYVTELQSEFPGMTVAILCDNQGQANRLKDLIIDEELMTSDYFVHVGPLSTGFSFPDGNALILNDHELFARKHFRKPKRIYRARKVLLDELSLKVGDYIVHEDFGIGQYLGLKKISIHKSEQEALKIQYKDGDVLFLNIEKLPNLEKFTGQEGVRPELSKLGGTDWIKIKLKTKKSIRNITGDLMEIYAKRLTAKGFAFSPDTLWQRELEASFLYDETQDQLKAAWDIKKDMESGRTMDRLICGDVGFGKTEVALRAAFKSVNDSKQVAILVPTTLLAQQHFETFKERLAAYPVAIEMLSRFRTRKEQLKIVGQIKSGAVDIIIGTHRLLSKDVEFKDLGLLIIDEEQRFGVTHKEKLKKLRAEVDILTLTATPIPRTLHMALLGARDLSTINTPPKNRLPIITEVSEYDEELIRAAIMKELDRGGQIYFVHNRVHTINKIVARLKTICPESTYGIAHGQMKETELERVMLAFLRGDFSCLVSTMIIESGLDIPTVNTIIINQADNFGLAQLYQLRGRVGRSDLQAFAYLLTPPFEKITDVALSRLQTLTEHTELGSGLQIATKDLEIRGAGNLLGAEQSGHINAVGYDMFTRLVQESVSEQLNDTLPEIEQDTKIRIRDIKVDADISTYFPDDYIPDEFQRVSFYRRLANLETFEQLDEFSETLTDRFGSPPDYAENLLMVIKIKILAAELNMKRIQIAGNKFTGSFAVDSEASAAQKEQLAQLVSSFVEKTSFQFRLQQSDRLKIELPLPDEPPVNKLNYIREFLESIKP